MSTVLGHRQPCGVCEETCEHEHPSIAAPLRCVLCLLQHREHRDEEVDGFLEMLSTVTTTAGEPSAILTQAVLDLQRRLSNGVRA